MSAAVDGTLFWLAVVCSLPGTSSPNNALTIEPNEIIAVLGENVTLTCRFEKGGNSSRGDDRFWWLRPDHNFRFVRNEAVLLGSLQRDRYSVRLDWTGETYSLAIANVQLLDGGKFMCSHRRGKYGDAYSSRVATLAVLSPPPGGYTACLYLAKSNLIMAPTREVALTCPRPLQRDGLFDGTEGRGFNGGVYFSWGGGLEGFVLQNGTTLLSYPSTVPHGEGSFCLAADGPHLRHSPRRCSLVPDADVAVALIQPAAVHVRVGEDVTFSCKVRGAVLAVDYEWVVPSNLPSEKVGVSLEGSAVTLVDVRGRSDGGRISRGIVSCRVTLENGVQIEALANVTVIKTGDGHQLPNAHEGAALPEEEGEESKPTCQANPASEERPEKSSSNSSFRDFVSNPERMAILLGPSLAVLVFFGCFYTALRFAVDKKVGSAAPPRNIATPPSGTTEKQTNASKESQLRAPAFPRSYSDAEAYQFSRNFEVHNSFQKGGDRGGRTHRPGPGTAERRDMNESMPSLHYKSNTLPWKNKRNRELPPPPNSFMDFPQRRTHSASHLEPPAVEDKPKRSVHFATTPPKQMKKVKK